MCGLIGFSGTKNYNTEHIKLLMYLNSVERFSKDSVGVYDFDNKEITKSVVSPITFLSTYEFKEASRFIGHVRNSTVGSISVSNAHPFNIDNIVGMHNGTLTNLDRFCKILDIEKDSNVTDSFHIFKALSKYQSPEILKYLTGAAAIIFTDTSDENKPLYVYKLNDERALFYGMTTEGMYISSEEDGLNFIGAKEITEFNIGMCYKIIDGVIISTKTLISENIPIIETNFNLLPVYVKTSVISTYKGEWIAVNKNFNKDLILDNNRGEKISNYIIDCNYNYEFYTNKVVKLLDNWTNDKDKKLVYGNAGDYVVITKVTKEEMSHHMTYVAFGGGGLTVYNPITGISWDLKALEIEVLPYTEESTQLSKLLKTNKVSKTENTFSWDKELILKGVVQANLSKYLYDFMKGSSTFPQLKEKLSSLIQIEN